MDKQTNLKFWKVSNYLISEPGGSLYVFFIQKEFNFHSKKEFFYWLTFSLQESEPNLEKLALASVPASEPLLFLASFWLTFKYFPKKLYRLSKLAKIQNIKQKTKL